MKLRGNVSDLSHDEWVRSPITLLQKFPALLNFSGPGSVFQTSVAPAIAYLCRREVIGDWAVNSGISVFMHVWSSHIAEYKSTG